MTFAAFDFLAGIKAAWAAGLGGLDRLAVDHTGRRAGLAALRPAGAPQENVVEPQPHLTGAPGIEVALHRSVGRKLLGQQTPWAAGVGEIEYRIDHRTYWRRAWPAALGRWGKLNCYHRPLAVGRIACITQPVPPILLPSDFSPCHAVLCRSSPPRQNRKLLKSLNRFTGQTLRAHPQINSSSLRPDGIVPISMEFVSRDIQLFHFFIRHFDAGGINAVVHHGGYGEPCFGFRVR